ncbi:DUF882 domain-containing protein [Geobacter pelophilus]|uniref:DUF882 domain-containing protein n=1 Tax=Geoanaerobacter pelophilus TaxID=60036 RepID=A0AAW4L4L9_9BACT|nr:D-Ala-D-Ala carboxypeptidase family metallohydrolase [Geoanaerobacter pelophilus]MBT0664755.1 DUF882 domain-containing protein [Geoanaerobacter pelophilus]
MKLTRHFTSDEFIVSQTAARLGIDNSPTPEVIANLQLVALVLEKVREYFGKPVLVSSGYRSPALNAAVPGSSKTSAHSKGLAADFTVQGVSNHDVCKWIAENIKELDIDQVIYEFGVTGWVHIGLAATPRYQMLSAIRGDGGKTVYVEGFRA